MSTYLWKYYLEDELEKFEQLLATATYSNSQSRPSYAGSLSTLSTESPSKSIATSPLSKAKTKGARAGRASATVTLTRADINSRDKHGVTLLHLMSSSKAESASQFGLAFLKVQMLDLYVQDLESGWTCLHRALYSGNISLARAIMERDMRDLHDAGGASHVGGLIKIKDHEGNSPFDVYATTIASRIIPHMPRQATLGSGDNDSEDEDEGAGENGNVTQKRLYDQDSAVLEGDELFAFGSNKNLTLGFGDEDDRQFPERVYLKRPSYLKDLFYKAHTAQHSRSDNSADSEQPEQMVCGDLPAVVDFRPIKIQDVQLSKLHSAVLTTDPESNLFLCGYGKGGRLGTGDEATRFNFVNISAGGLQKRKIVAIGLGQNHTIAVTQEGEVYTWGSNKYGQLGYSLANQTSTETDPMQLHPRQLFGLLKREFIAGCAASRTHSVVFTSNSLYTFGKHDGQLGLVDSDARALEMQVTPRKVAASLFSSPISMATAIDKATACLLENHDVWVFANYGYAKLTFPLDGFSNYFIRGSFSSAHYDRPNYITKICAGGDTICALAQEGDVYTVNVSQKIDPSAGSSSTTNPSKIKGALSAPQRIWSLRKEHMAVRDVNVGQDGSVIICTNSGSVWRRIKRAKIKDASSAATASDNKPKDHKFSRIPGLTRVAAVRSNAYGGFAAVRKDSDVLRSQIQVGSKSLWADVLPLLAFTDLCSNRIPGDKSADIQLAHNPANIKRAILTSKDIETDLAIALRNASDRIDSNYDVSIGSTVSDLRVPCHQFLLMARSTVLRKGFFHFKKSYYFEVPDVVLIEYDKNGIPLIVLQGADILTLINFVLYLYTDTIVSFWNFRQRPQFASRYREVRVELMKLAAQLDMRDLEHSARLMTEPKGVLHRNLDKAILDPDYLQTGDVEVELADGSIKLHSALVCQRCPFFEGLFHGRAKGSWLSSRLAESEEVQEAVKIDLKHINTACFSLVVRHLYSDAGDEIFEDTTASNLESFLDTVLDVLEVANELMIDRLAEICQKVIGSYVAPCSVSEFKDAALEYICLNLEGMLENHLLDELDEELMAELDRVVRDNQLTQLPMAKSGRAEQELIEIHPELPELIERAKQIKIDSMALQSHFHEDEIKMAKYASKSPMLRAKNSAADMMFSMDEDALDIVLQSKTPSTPPIKQEKLDSDPWLNSPPPSLSNDNVWFDSKGKQLSPASASLQGRVLTKMDPSTSYSTHDDDSPTDTRLLRKSNESSPWADATLSTSKLSMKQIMAQASESRQSNISMAFSKFPSPATSSPVSLPKLSQRERKRLHQQQQQQQLQKALDAAQSSSELMQPTSKPSPWQIPTSGPKVSIKEDLLNPTNKSSSFDSSKRRPSPSPSLTMRQTIPGNAKQKEHSTSPMQAPRPQRTVSSPSAPTMSRISNSPAPSRPPPQTRRSQDSTAGPSASRSSPIVPRSVRHDTGRANVEPALQISITDILAQQQIEKDLIREATVKRSLQEIQEEQAFQEWWDQEEAATKARMEQEEAASKAAASESTRGRAGRGRGKSRGGGSGNAGSGRGRGRGRSGGKASAGGRSGDSVGTRGKST